MTNNFVLCISFFKIYFILRENLEFVNWCLLILIIGSRSSKQSEILGLSQVLGKFEGIEPMAQGKSLLACMKNSQI